MAASATIWFPRIKVLATVYLDGNLGTENGTEATPGAFSLFLLLFPLAEVDRSISFLIESIRGFDQSFGADGDAEMALLAQLWIDFDVA